MSAREIVQRVFLDPPQPDLFDGETPVERTEYFDAETRRRLPAPDRLDPDLIRRIPQ